MMMDFSPVPVCSKVCHLLNMHATEPLFNRDLFAEPPYVDLVCKVWRDSINPSNHLFLTEQTTSGHCRTKARVFGGKKKKKKKVCLAVGLIIFG